MAFPSLSSPLLHFRLSIILYLLTVSSEFFRSAREMAIPLKDVSADSPILHFAISLENGFACERICVAGTSLLNLPRYANSRRVTVTVSGAAGKRFQGLQGWRLVCLLMVSILHFYAPLVSSWALFYYTSSMALEDLLLVIFSLHQGMKLIFMGNKSILYISLFGSLASVATFSVHFFTRLVKSILVNFGIRAEIHIHSTLGWVAWCTSWFICSLITSKNWHTPATQHDTDTDTDVMNEVDTGSPRKRRRTSNVTSPARPSRKGYHAIIRRMWSDGMVRC